MTNPNPPQNLQVVGGPQATPAPAVVAAPAPTQTPAPAADYVDPVPAEDRILSPEETEQFFRTGTTEPQAQVPETPEELDQAKLAGDFFEGLPPQHTTGPLAAPAGPTAQPTPQQIQQSVQEMQQGPAAVAPGQAQPIPGQPAPQPGQPVQSAPTQTPQEAALAAQVQTLSSQVNTLLGNNAQLQQQIQQPQQAQQQPQQAAAPQYNMQIPQQFMAALESENPQQRAQALNAIMNGVAAATQQQTLAAVDQRLEQVGPRIQQQVQESNSQAEVKRDMYGTYPELSNMMGQVVAVAQQLESQGLAGNGAWTPEFRDNIAERLAPLVPGLAQKIQQVRSARGAQQVQQPQYGQQPQYALPQQNLPQVPPQGLPPGVLPVQVQGGMHVPMAGGQVTQPVYVRDAYGNISQVHPQQHQQLAGTQARPGGQGQVDPALQDIWSTLGY